MLMPVLNVPYEATIIALFSCSVISLLFLCLLLPHHHGQKTHDEYPPYSYLSFPRVVVHDLLPLKKNKGITFEI